jgi:tetratricopeptide (TPR) repeat protein
LLCYRAKEYEEAVQYLNESAQVDPRWVNWIGRRPNSLNSLGLALAYHRLGQNEEAQLNLIAGRAAIVGFIQSLFDARDPPNIRIWQEWQEALLLYREAKLLIDGTPPDENPRLWVVRGRALAAINLKDKAAAAASRALTLAPNDTAIHEACFRLYAELGYWDQANAEHAAAVKANPEDPLVVLQFFRYFAERENWEKAEAALDPVLREHSRDSRVWVAAGQVYGQKGRWQHAVANYTAALGLMKQDDPRRATAQLGRARAHLQLKEDDKALADVRELGPGEPDQAGELSKVWRDLAQRLFAAKKYPEALEGFSQAIKLNPRDSFSLYYRARCYMALQQWDKVLVDSSRAIQLDRNYAGSWLNRGFAYGKLGQWDKALDDYSKVTELDPKFAGAWNNRGNAHRHLGHLDQALADYSKALQLDTNHRNARTSRAHAYCQLGQWENAAADYAKLLELDPSDHWHWYSSAALRSQIGDADGYRRACREMLARFGNTDDPAVAERTAKTCSLAPHAVGDYESVLRIADRAVSARGSDRWILLSKALAEYRADHPAAAIEGLHRLSPKADGEHLDATAFAVLTLAHHSLGQTQEGARQCPGDPRREDARPQQREVLRRRLARLAARPDPHPRGRGDLWQRRTKADEVRTISNR